MKKTLGTPQMKNLPTARLTLKFGDFMNMHNYLDVQNTLRFPDSGLLETKNWLDAKSTHGFGVARDAWMYNSTI